VRAVEAATIEAASAVMRTMPSRRTEPAKWRQLRHNSLGGDMAVECAPGAGQVEVSDLTG
jgi:hypothetical protein